MCWLIRMIVNAYFNFIESYSSNLSQNFINISLRNVNRCLPSSLPHSLPFFFAAIILSILNFYFSSYLPIFLPILKLFFLSSFLSHFPSVCLSCHLICRLYFSFNSRMMWFHWFPTSTFQHERKEILYSKGRKKNPLKFRKWIERIIWVIKWRFFTILNQSHQDRKNENFNFKYN